MAPRRHARADDGDDASGGRDTAAAATTTATSTSTSDNDAAADAIVARWAREYPLPEEAPAAAAAAASGKDLMPPMSLYKPPRDDFKGAAIALTVIAAWCLAFYHALFQIRLGLDGNGGGSGSGGKHGAGAGGNSAAAAAAAATASPPRSSLLDIVGTFLLLEQLYTGLFITTHDAMHGNICFGRRWLNDLLGRVAISLYAWMDYKMLWEAHWEHHNHTGVVGRDPDFHNGRSIALLPWFGRFMGSYFSVAQFAKIALASQVLQALGAPYWNLVVYMAGSALVAAFRLFYFGTYVVHLPQSPDEPMPWWKSHSSAAPWPVTFWQAWHFTLHLEHHRWPYAPWWDLPRARRLLREYREQQQQQAEQHAKAVTAAAAK